MFYTVFILYKPYSTRIQASKVFQIILTVNDQTLSWLNALAVKSPNEIAQVEHLNLYKPSDSTYIKSDGEHNEYFDSNSTVIWGQIIVQM